MEGGFFFNFVLETGKCDGMDVMVLIWFGGKNTSTLGHVLDIGNVDLLEQIVMMRPFCPI